MTENILNLNENDCQLDLELQSSTLTCIPWMSNLSNNYGTFRHWGQIVCVEP